MSRGRHSNGVNTKNHKKVKMEGCQKNQDIDRSKRQIKKEIVQPRENERPQISIRIVTREREKVSKQQKNAVRRVQTEVVKKEDARYKIEKNIYISVGTLVQT